MMAEARIRMLKMQQHYKNVLRHLQCKTGKKKMKTIRGGGQNRQRQTVRGLFDVPSLFRTAALLSQWLSVIASSLLRYSQHSNHRSVPPSSSSSLHPLSLLTFSLPVHKISAYSSLSVLFSSFLSVHPFLSSHSYITLRLFWLETGSVINLNLPKCLQKRFTRSVYSPSEMKLWKHLVGFVPVVTDAVMYVLFCFVYAYNRHILFKMLWTQNCKRNSYWHD